MEWSDFLNPINTEELRKPHSRARFGDVITIYQEAGNFPALDGMDIAIVGVEEARAALKDRKSVV